MKWLLLTLLLAGCASGAQRELVIKDLRIHVVGDAKELPCGTHGCANSGNVWVVGGYDEDGLVVVNDAVLGHEMRHVLNKRDAGFRDPDTDLKYRVYKALFGWW